MAQGATLYRFQIDLADADRGVYEQLDLRLARHPSESLPFLMARLLARCLCHEDGLEFGKGISTTDEPALWARHGDGRVRLWIEVGSPSSDRMRKASRIAERVVVFAYRDAEKVAAEAAEAASARGPRIEVRRVPPEFLDTLGAAAERDNRWQITVSGGQVFVTSGEATVAEGAVGPTPTD